jgi:hypothetical protein
VYYSSVPYLYQLLFWLDFYSFQNSSRSWHCTWVI